MQNEWKLTALLWADRKKMKRQKTRNILFWLQFFPLFFCICKRANIKMLLCCSVQYAHTSCFYCQWHAMKANNEWEAITFVCCCCFHYYRLASRFGSWMTRGIDFGNFSRLFHKRLWTHHFGPTNRHHRNACTKARKSKVVLNLVSKESLQRADIINYNSGT